MNEQVSTRAPTIAGDPEAAPSNILLIGGTGSVGRLLQPVLARRGHKVAIASRNANTDCAVIGQDQWDAAISQADIVVVLSAINNDVSASAEQIHKINVDFPLALAERCSQNSRQSIVLFGSDLANVASPTSLYARSKAELLLRLTKQENGRVGFLVLSPVYGEQFVKRLAIINQLPAKMRSAVIAAIGAARPLTHVERIADAIEKRHLAPESGLIIEHVVDNQCENPFYRAFTRIFDLAFSFSVIVITGWLIAVVAIAIATTSAGPVLFRQDRIGRDGRIFSCLKFRTMHLDTPQLETHKVPLTSITTIGRYIRSWKLDELPQILNIIANQMSLVGPRPCLPTQHTLINARQKLGVLRVKPGVTGWSQVRRFDLSDPDRLAQSDEEFCARRSIPFYLRIVMLTFLGKGQGDYVR